MSSDATPTRTNFDRYKNYCACLETTPLYVEFSWYNLISACLQRRVWLGKHEANRIYANLYLIFVGDPGTGKTVATRVNLYLLNRFKTVNKANKEELKIPIAPDTIGVEALIRKLAYGTKMFMVNGVPYVQAPLTFLAEELANLFKKDDQQLVKFLLQGYDCGDYTKELKGAEKFNNVESVFNMCINFLGATTPENMTDFMARGLLSDGFLGRAIFIYGGRPQEKKTFFEPNFDQVVDLKYIEDYCRCLTELCGEVEFSKEAREYLEDWYQNKNIILNEDRKLLHYYGRKKINAIKLSIIQHFCETKDSLVVEVESVKKALEALARIELTMHLALASVGRNPIHYLSEQIAYYLAEKKRQNPNNPERYRKTRDQLNMIFFSEGEFDQIAKAIEHLILSLKIQPVAMGSVLGYEIREEKV